VVSLLESPAKELAAMSVGQVFISAINHSISLEVDYDHHLRLVSSRRTHLEKAGSSFT
jgi:hypothetical protein